MHQKQKAVENSVGKEEITGNKQFLFFLQCFLLNQINVPICLYFWHHVFAAELEEPKLAYEVNG